MNSMRAWRTRSRSVGNSESGCPVVAFAAGGCLETVVGDGPEATGTFFHHQDIVSLNNAVEELERRKAGGLMMPKVLMDHAQHFCSEIFRRRIAKALENVSGLL